MHRAMLILNADDYGRNRQATDRILACYRHGSVTSTSGMVFMDDSQRAGELARESKIDIGLHLNLSERLTGSSVPPKLRERHDRVAALMNRSRYSSLLFHPMRVGDFRYLWQSQYDEFLRVYGVAPSHVDGHHHLHLSTNMLVQRLVPRGVKIRRSFSFVAGEKSLVNRAYRALVDRWQSSRYVMPDYLFSLPDCLRRGRLEYAVSLAATAAVEVESHPELTADYEWLIGEQGLKAFAGRRLGTYGELAAR